MAKHHVALGIDIGGSGIKGAVVNLEKGEFTTKRKKILTPKPATPEAVIEVDRPERLAEFGERVAAPHVVDQDVQSLVSPLNAGHELFHFSPDRVIHSYGNSAAAGGGDQLSSFLDRFRTAWRRGPSPCSFS